MCAQLLARQLHPPCCLLCAQVEIGENDNPERAIYQFTNYERQTKVLEEVCCHPAPPLSIRSDWLGSMLGQGCRSCQRSLIWAMTYQGPTKLWFRSQVVVHTLKTGCCGHATGRCKGVSQAAKLDIVMAGTAEAVF